MSGRTKAFAGILLLLWTLLVISAYFVVHKPWVTTTGLVSLTSIADGLIAVALVFIAGGIGRRILGTLESLHRLEAVAAQAAVGFGFLSLAVLLAGIGHLITTPIAWSALLLASLATFRSGGQWAADFRDGMKGGGERDAVERFSAIVVVFLLSLSLIDALAPPLKWDSLVYHLALPKHYVDSGAVGFVSGNLFGGFPQLPEMLYTWAMALHAGTTAALVGWAGGVLALVGLAGLVKRGLGLDRGWLALAIVLSGASLWQGLAWAYVDHWVLLYGVVLATALDAHTRRLPGPWLPVAGMAIGFAVSAKYTAIFLGLAATVWLLANALTEDTGATSTTSGGGSQASLGSRLRAFAGNTALVGSIGLALALPWLVKNTLLTGNPVYPFILPGRELDALRQAFHAKGESTSSLLDAILLPWRATVLGVEGRAGFNTSIGPLYLALIPGLLMGLKSFGAASRRLLHRAALLALVAWVLWGAGEFLADPLIRSRHYYGFLPAMALLAVAGFQRISGLRLGELRLGWVISRLVLFSLLLTLVGGLFHFAAQDPLPVVMGQRSQQEFLADRLGWFGPTMAYLETLPPTAKVEMLWEARSYYCSRPCVPDEILDKWWHLQRTLGDNREIARQWAQTGVSHVLIYDFGADYERRTNKAFEPSDWQALQAFREQDLELIKVFGTGYSLYRLVPPVEAASSPGD
jgi:hypothetical protein